MRAEYMRVEYVDCGDRNRIEVTLGDRGPVCYVLPIGRPRRSRLVLLPINPFDPLEGLTADEREAELSQLALAPNVEPRCDG